MSEIELRYSDGYEDIFKYIDADESDTENYVYVCDEIWARGDELTCRGYHFDEDDFRITAYTMGPISEACLEEDCEPAEEEYAEFILDFEHSLG